MNAKQEDPVLDALQSCAKTLQDCAIAFASCAKTAAASLDHEKTKDNCRLTVQCCQSLLELEKVSKEILPSSVQQNPWQPIETAPKDGTKVLLVLSGDYCVGWWEDNSDIGFMSGWTNDMAYDLCSMRNPTHWMPLPPPPTTGGQDETS